MDAARRKEENEIRREMQRNDITSREKRERMEKVSMKGSGQRTGVFKGRDRPLLGLDLC